ncbi:VOC family protein [Aureispira sp. CCB-E]|uniref:VOC family protein n=1 Tax=Aureispira sp. CCB-E TaxID=3051121 RepID=UPI00286883A3|nr:VOC family protein [Aureispira sp. CCB-E]WMX13707.1 VOC family protein [Aureispira sp. CCB-E]
MKYVHTNIISKDWKALAGFYIQVFNCKLLLPQRDLSGEWLSKATGVPNAHIKGAHLRLPGYGKNGPTLEIFEYDKMEAAAESMPNRKGFGHLAFEVDDVHEVVEKVLELGGKKYGRIATKSIPDLGTLTFVYVQDPEGNIIEIQNWGTTLPVKEVPKTSEEPVQLPMDKDAVLTVEGKEEDREVSPKTTLNEPLSDNLETPISKRALLDELQRDLDASKYDLEETKQEVKDSKEDAKYQERKVKSGLKYDPDSELVIPKSKKELLSELKDEMQLNPKKELVLPKTKLPLEEDTTNSKEVKKQVKKIELPPIPADLRVEYKKDRVVTVLDLEHLNLSMTSDQLAQNLWSFSNLNPSDNEEKTFLECLGETYRADLVPLKKQYKAEDNNEENEKAWALTPRLRDSLKHFLGQCEEHKNALEDLKLEQINSSPKAWVETYQNLLLLTLAVEEKGGTELRLGYL